MRRDRDGRDQGAWGREMSRKRRDGRTRVWLMGWQRRDMGTGVQVMGIRVQVMGRWKRDRQREIYMNRYIYL